MFCLNRKKTDLLPDKARKFDNGFSSVGSCEKGFRVMESAVMESAVMESAVMESAVMRPCWPQKEVK